MTQQQHDPAQCDLDCQISEYIMSITDNGRTLLDVVSEIARGDDPTATREDRNEAIRLIIQYQDRMPDVFRVPGSLPPGNRGPPRLRSRGGPRRCYRGSLRRRESPAGGQSPLDGVDAAQHRRARVPLLRRTPRADRDHRRSGGGPSVTWGCRRRSRSPVPPGLPRCFSRPERPGRPRCDRAPRPRPVRFPACLIRTSQTARRAPPCTVGLPPYAPGESVRA